jgi:hypothetical protein
LQYKRRTMAEPELIASSSRGSMYTAQEDLMIAQAFCAASEDSIKGNYQKGDVFKETMRAAYTELCIEYSKQQHANLIQTCMNNSRTNNRLNPAPHVPFTPGMNMFSTRNADSVMKRFKSKIAKDSMSFLGICTCYPLISGESEGTRGNDGWLPFSCVITLASSTSSPTIISRTSPSGWPIAGCRTPAFSICRTPIVTNSCME